MTPRLGLVCITHSDEVRYRTVTRKRLLQFPGDEQKRMLRELYAANLVRLNAALDFCSGRGLSLYRMTSGLFPFADDEAGTDVLEEFTAEAARTGARAAELGIRLVLHPDQFVVLSSDSPQTVANSVKILESHARVMDMLGLPRSPWALIEIHGGKGGRSERLVEQIGLLPEAVRARIAFENDEYIYSAAEILDVCRRAGVPMVFDAHHHVVHEKLDSYDHPSRGRDGRGGARDVATPRVAARPHLERPRVVLRPPPQRPHRVDARRLSPRAVDRGRGQAQGAGHRAPPRRLALVKDRWQMADGRWQMADGS